MLRKLRVYGKLAKFLKRRVFEIEVASAAEAVRFMLANFPSLEKHMAEQYYRVTVGDYDLCEEELQDPVGNQDIKIAPVIVGSGGPVGRIILGVALVAFSLLLPGVGAAIGGALMTQIGLIGAALILGGVAQLLTPLPKINSVGKGTDDDPRKSYSFSGIQQTGRQGVPVPICYGERLVGSIVVSAGIDTEQVVA